MTNTDSIRQAGDYMATEYLARRPLDVMTQPFAPTDEASAYAIQEAFLNRVAEAGDTTVWGYKIAYTNNVMRERAGIYEPVSGLILASGVHDSGAMLDSADYYRLGIECEVAVRMGADLPASGAPYTRESVSDAIEWLAVSFELVDGREGAVVEGVDPSLRAIVVNISNGGAVLGEPVRDWQGLDLVASSGRMLVNGEVVGEGSGRGRAGASGGAGGVACEQSRRSRQEPEIRRHDTYGQLRAAVSAERGGRGGRGDRGAGGGAVQRGLTLRVSVPN